MESTPTRPLWAALQLVTSDAGTVVYSLRPPPPWEQLKTQTRELTTDEIAFLTDWCAAGGPMPGPGALSAGNAADLIATLDAFGLMVDDDTTTRTATPTDRPEKAEPVPSTETFDPGHDYIIAAPQLWRIGAGVLERLDHDGSVSTRVTPAELGIAEIFASPTTPVAAAEVAAERLGAQAPSDLLETIAQLARSSVILDATESPDLIERRVGEQRRLRASIAGHMRLLKRVEHHNERRDRELDAAGFEPPLIAVHPVLVGGPVPPLSLGMILTRATQWEDGRLSQNYDLHPRWLRPGEDVETLPVGPAVYLFSDYIWSHQANLELSRRIKAHNPEGVIVHGGPDCPSYEADIATYLRTHPYVDVAVRGEGEATACELLDALGPSLRAGRARLDDLSEVAGLSYCVDDVVTRTADRNRIVDIDTIPSPYTSGTFEAFGELPELDLAIIETNRGCPYGCTFCDWGSATNSRIRKFDLDRVFAELEWCADHKVKRIFIADANFGIFARDVEIVQRIADLHTEHGYPKRIISNYAKNTVKHLRQIVEILSSVGILTEGLLSLQSMDDGTLEAIRRSNIKLEKYEALAAEFRAEKLPLFVDLMMGLPGQTVGSLLADLQQCVDREVLAKCHGTELLVNSPMNDPAYREEHQIVSIRPPGAQPIESAKSGPALVVSASTFTRDDYWEMHRVRRAYLLGENLGVFRFISRFVRQEADVPEVELIERVRKAAESDPGRWPVLRLVTATVPDSMVPPMSWRLFTDELRVFLVDELGMRDGSGMETALTVQHAVLPAPDRHFPYEVWLGHDFAAWHDLVLEAKLGGNRTDWPSQVPPLETFGPASFAVEDPRDVCGTNLLQGSAIDAYGDWELDSPVARAVPGHNQI